MVTNAGQSSFRCDLAVRRPEAPALTTAVLVDQHGRFATYPFDERRITQPAALTSAGWRVVQVLATDWQSAPNEVLDRIVATL